MKISILNQNNQEKSKKELPKQFNEEIRPDLILRAVLSIQSNKRQKYGADPEAGKRPSAKLSRRRRDYKGSYGIGISRVPRKIISRRGTRMNWVGAFAPGTVGGRRAHPPKAEKKWSQKINRQERRKAIRSALSAAMNKQLAEKRGHEVPEKYPFIIDNYFENIQKTKDLKAALMTLGFEKELERSEEKKVRAGRGKSRGRKYKRKKGILFVVSKECNLLKSAKNLPGSDVIEVKNINAELLAPGGVPGRLTLFTEAAIDAMSKENLFY
ncbi:MAG: 50S ribosomal protein L4 [Nanoarchaeota archaeon]|nr:50S ribosomal protein L4 [Nanoarchaeota archaeon]